MTPSSSSLFVYLSAVALTLSICGCGAFGKKLIHKLLSESKRMNCPCGEATVGGQEPTRSEEADPDKMVRIVDGYEPNERPWMAYIEIASKRKGGFGRCGGSIINKRWVLSAGHCFCVHTKCKKNYKGETVIDFDPQKKVVAVLGLKDIRMWQRYRDHVFNPIEIVIHPKYDPKGNIQDDLALLKMHKDIGFTRKIMPICLPMGKRFPDRKGDVFVAGWGRISDDKCTTDEFGPSPNTKCKFPFRFHSISFSSCVKMASPTNQDKICRSLKVLKRIKPFPDDGVHSINVRTKNSTNNLLSTCYNMTHGSYGWCGTCLEGTRPGQPGYCGPKAKRDETEIIDVKPNENWGFCNKNCVHKTFLSDMLQEAKLEIAPKELCRELGSEFQVRVSTELCAGHRITVRQDEFLAEKAASNDAADAWKFQRGPEKRLGVNSNVTYGGRDSCTGDSGGPLWKWVGKSKTRAFIIGVVSRGKGCARKNAPGIYSRTKMYLDWIYSVAGGDKC